MSSDSPIDQTEQAIQTTGALKTSDPFHIIDHFFSKQYLNNHQHYHRSKVYTPTSGSNPMLAASYPLFSMLHRIRQSLDQNNSAIVDPAQWQHELRAFVDALSMTDYSREVIGSACFALMVMIDETTQSLHHSPSLPALLLPEHLHDIQTSQLFYHLIDACCRDEKKHAHLLELLYYCLENGYIGFYAQKNQGLFELNQLRNQILKTLKKHRAYDQPWLVKSPTVKAQSPSPWRWVVKGVMLSAALLSIQLGYQQWRHHHPIPANPSIHQVSAPR